MQMLLLLLRVQYYAVKIGPNLPPTLGNRNVHRKQQLPTGDKKG